MDSIGEAMTMKTYVEEVVRTSKLLEHLDRRHKCGTVEHLVLEFEDGPEVSLDLLFVLDGAPHLLDLDVDGLVVQRLLLRDAARASKGTASIVETALGDEPTWRLRHGKDTEAKDCRPDETDTDDCAP